MRLPRAPFHPAATLLPSSPLLRNVPALAPDGVVWLVRQHLTKIVIKAKHFSVFFKQLSDQLWRCHMLGGYVAARLKSICERLKWMKMIPNINVTDQWAAWTKVIPPAT